MLLGALATAAIPIVFQMSGKAVLEKAIDARERIHSGILRYREVCELGGEKTECEATAIFDVGHFRLDIQDHSAFRSDSNKDEHRFDPLRMSFDGTVVLDRQIQFDVATFRTSELNGTRIPFANARHLGLPGAPGSRLSIRECLRADQPVTSYSKDQNLHRITIGISRPTNPAGATLRLVIDENRGWSIIEYEYRGTERDNSQFQVKCEVTPFRFDDFWYPVIVHKEVWMDGTLRNSQDVAVSDASFNIFLSPDTFTWEGLGIFDGAIIQGTAPGSRSTIYRSSSSNGPKDQPIQLENPEPRSALQDPR